MTQDERRQELAPEVEPDIEVSVRFADRQCPRCRSRFVASYYRDGGYVKSRCLDCMLFWPTPLMA
jgi:hypothetical protein